MDACCRWSRCWAGSALLFGVYGRWGGGSAGTDARRRRCRFRAPGDVALTPAQRVTAWFFLVVAVLFLLQNLVGARRRALPGRDRRLLRHRPAAGLPLQPDPDLAPPAGDLLRGDGVPGGRHLPGAADRRARAARQGTAGLRAARRAGGGRLRQAGRRVPEQPRPARARGLELVRRAGLGVPRPRPVLEVPAHRSGWSLWVVHLWRVLRPRLADESRGNLPWLFLYSCAVDPGLLRGRPADPHADNFAIGDFWRFWVVHLWVEDFLELFTTMLVAYIFVLMGIVSERFASPSDLLRRDALLGRRRGRHAAPLLLQRRPGRAHGARGVLLGGRGHPADVPDGRGVVVPPARRRARQSRAQTPFPHRWAVLFLVAVGFWNFLGAGVFGFLINLPVVSYYEIGTRSPPTTATRPSWASTACSPSGWRSSACAT